MIGGWVPLKIFTIPTNTSGIKRILEDPFQVATTDPLFGVASAESHLKAFLAYPGQGKLTAGIPVQTAS